MTSKTILVYGHTGWIGSKLCKLLESQEFIVVKSNARLDDFSGLTKELKNILPDVDYVLNAAGITGGSVTRELTRDSCMKELTGGSDMKLITNIEWCEQSEENKIKTLEVNVIGASIIAGLCYRYQKHYTYIGSGCIYNYDCNHPEPIEALSAQEYESKYKGFTEDDEPNFQGSFYSFTKSLIDSITKRFSNALVLRIRMPISDDFHPRSLITKLTKYQKILDCKNSITILHDLLPIVPDMISKKLTGVYNFVNPGLISNCEILELYKKYINPEFSYIKCSLNELQLKVPRSNNFLSTKKLLSLYDIPDVRISIHDVFKRILENKSN